jgi:two-component system CheB/CheR fusion protein
MRILLIDDSVDATDMLAMLLEAQGHSVIVAFSGMSGIALGLSADFDLTIVDLGLPDIDGIEVIETLHHLCLGKSCQIFVYTCRGDLAARREAIVAGATCVFVKGGDIAELLDQTSAGSNG